MVWQKDVCQRRDLLGVPMNDPGGAGLACLPEKDYVMEDAVKPRPREDVVEHRLHLTVTGLADHLHTTVVLFEARGQSLHLVSSAVRSAAVPSLADASAVATRAVSSDESPAPAVATLADSPWTLVRVRAGRRVATLAVHGDQLASAPRIAAAATTLSAMLAEHEALRAARCQTATHALSRRLASAYGFPRMADIVSSAAARLLGARVTSTAIFDPVTQVLKVHGTYEYPSLLVEHARIMPGEGIIGSVFQSGVPLCVPDVRTHDDTTFRSRPRYRTHSFLAVPVRAGQRTLGVISATDREDGRPFTR